MRTVQELIEDYEKEIEELKKIQSKNKEFSFHWSMAEGAIGECKAFISDLKRINECKTT